MTTAFNTSTGEQEVLIWAEKDGAAVSGTTASIVVTDNTGAMVWNANALAPNSDGVYRFSHQWQPLAGRNYYIKISIMVDGVLRVNKQSFYT
jgi:hypothetical protein